MTTSRNPGGRSNREENGRRSKAKVRKALGTALQEREGTQAYRMLLCLQKQYTLCSSCDRLDLRCGNPKCKDMARLSVDVF